MVQDLKRASFLKRSLDKNVAKLLIAEELEQEVDCQWRSIAALGIDVPARPRRPDPPRMPMCMRSVDDLIGKVGESTTIHVVPTVNITTADDPKMGEKEVPKKD